MKNKHNASQSANLQEWPGFGCEEKPQESKPMEWEEELFDYKKSGIDHVEGSEYNVEREKLKHFIRQILEKQKAEIIKKIQE